MQQPEVSKFLKKVGYKNELHFVQTLKSSVTTAWGVNWDENYIARDLMQNFFDANRKRLTEVEVNEIDSHVLVTAPEKFHLERLFYLGSEKGNDDVGHYGEGFKVAATCLLRDHAVTPIAISGHDLVVLKISDQVVADTKMCPIEYDFYKSNIVVDGTVLILPGCTRKLIEAMRGGLSHFFYEQNPLLGEKLWSDNKNEFEIYHSKVCKGHVFYRKLKRGEMEDVPLVLVINKTYQRLEQKISKDRDRNAFGEEVMEVFYSLFAKNGIGGYNRDAIKIILIESSQNWVKGHPLIREIASHIRTPWSEEVTRDLFHKKYYARSNKNHDPAVQVDIERLERGWEREERTCLPGYFGKFGVANAVDELKRIREKALAESMKNDQRVPTPIEYKCILLLGKLLEQLDPEVMAIFNRGRTSYTVARTETLLGELKSGRSYYSRDVFLSEFVFEEDFPQAVAVFLHEHSHIYGHDGSRGFTDALTHLLETVIRQRHDLEIYELEWEKLRKAVRQERKKASKNPDIDRLEEWLSSKNEEELRCLFKQLPHTYLKRLRKKPVDTD